MCRGSRESHGCGKRKPPLHSEQDARTPLLPCDPADLACSQGVVAGNMEIKPAKQHRCVAAQHAIQQLVSTFLVYEEATRHEDEVDQLRAAGRQRLATTPSCRRMVPSQASLSEKMQWCVSYATAERSDALLRRMLVFSKNGALWLALNARYKRKIGLAT